LISEKRTNGHRVSRLTTHIVWSTKHRYLILKGDIQVRCRTLLMQIRDSKHVITLIGVVSKDHVHMHIEYRPSKSGNYLVKKLKGRSSRKLQQELPVLKQGYWVRHFWGIGHGCWSNGNINDEMVNE